MSSRRRTRKCWRQRRRPTQPVRPWGPSHAGRSAGTWARTETNGLATWWRDRWETWRTRGQWEVWREATRRRRGEALATGRWWHSGKRRRRNISGARCCREWGREGETPTTRCCKIISVFILEKGRTEGRTKRHARRPGSSWRTWRRHSKRRWWHLTWTT